MNCTNCDNNLTITKKQCDNCRSDSLRRAREAKSGGSSRVKVILSSIGVVVLIVVVSFVSRFVGRQAGSAISEASVSKKDIINAGVEGVRKEVQFPYKIDETTILENVSGTDTSIKYEYKLVGVQSGSLDIQQVTKSVTDKACNDTNTRKIIDRDVNLDYNYTYDGTSDSFLITVAKKDCA